MTVIVEHRGPRGERVEKRIPHARAMYVLDIGANVQQLSIVSRGCKDDFVCLMVNVFSILATDEI